MTLKTTNFKNFRKKKSIETFRLNVWESKYLSSNIQIFFGRPNAST